MNILFDTNIVLDVLLNRQPHVALSAKLMRAVENKQITGYLCATTITTLDYLLSKASSQRKARTALQQLLGLFEIAGVDKRVIDLSMQSKFDDFEDAVQYYSGECCGVAGLVTRNIKDYKPARLPVYLPNELLAQLALLRSPN